MSEYCGKCDFYDSICIGAGREDNSIEKWLEGTEIFIGSPFSDYEPIRIEAKTERDIAPLYPHLVVVGTSSNGKRRYYLTERPFYGLEDEDRLDRVIEDVKRAVRSLKRKKVEVTEDSIKDMVYCSESDEDMHNIICAVLNGYKPRLPRNMMSGYYRRKHYDKLVDLGYSCCAAYLITHYDKRG